MKRDLANCFAFACLDQAWNVLQGYVSQHSMPDLHDKEGNDIMTEKKMNDEYCVNVNG